MLRNYLWSINAISTFIFFLNKTKTSSTKKIANSLLYNIIISVPLCLICFSIKRPISFLDRCHSNGSGVFNYLDVTKIRYQLRGPFPLSLSLAYSLPYTRLFHLRFSLIIKKKLLVPLSLYLYIDIFYQFFKRPSVIYLFFSEIKNLPINFFKQRFTIHVTKNDADSFTKLASVATLFQ